MFPSVSLLLSVQMWSEKTSKVPWPLGDYIFGLCPKLLTRKYWKDGNEKAQWIMTQVANVAAQRDPRMKAYCEGVAS
ncbi:MAG: hypothetical protein PXY39_07290 [archaeon]|nr:hypothetical protein [archaeon]